MPITSINQPNAGLSLAPSIFFAIAALIKIPAIAKAETFKRKVQSMRVSDPSSRFNY